MERYFFPDWCCLEVPLTLRGLGRDGMEKASLVAVGNYGGKTCVV